MADNTLFVIQLYDYPVKILLALEMAISGKHEFARWLLDNNYPELAALANAIRGGDKKAIEWLLDHGFQHFAAFDAASVDDDQALAWLKRYDFEFLVILAQASRGGDQDSINWLNNRELKIFVRIAKQIKFFLLTAKLSTIIRCHSEPKMFIR